MDQFVLLPASVYKSLNTNSVTKQELPKYQPQNPTNQIDSLKMKTNKKLLAKAEILVGKN